MESKIRQIITQLNIATSSNTEHEKHEELKAIYKQLLPYAEIEEELGVDIITLFTALNNPICIKGYKGAIWCSNRLIGKCFSDYLLVVQEDTMLYPKDYGKTWSLTKEELEKNNEKRFN